MGTAYQVPNMAAYENHHLQHHSAYASAAASSDRTRAALNERSVPNEQLFNPSVRCPSQTQQQQQMQTQVQQHGLPQPRTLSYSTATSSVSSTIPVPTQSSTSRQSTRASTPSSAVILAGGDPRNWAGDSVMTTHSLEIPTCISPDGGNLADFVAELTLFFWFESVMVLQAAGNGKDLAPSAASLRKPKSAIVDHHFRKWVQSVLSTTQVTQNVILLALMFIYRLRLANPKMKGQPGSEYRLLTVALMLGNKFLDDNTYTNKTWADVSCISVRDIHVMEVEFLGNMRYSLLASRDQWEEWLVKLGRFWDHLERARQSTSPSPLMIPSPTARAFVSPSPSPTATLQSSTLTLSPTPQSVNTYSPTANGNGYATNGGSQTWSMPSYSSNNYTPNNNNSISPLAQRPVVQPPRARKRSFPEDDPTEPPAKRMSTAMPLQPQHPSHQLPSQQPRQQQPISQYQQHHQLAHPAQSRNAHNAAHDQARLSVPSLTLNTAQASSMPLQSSYLGVGYAPPQASPLSLPPIMPGIRAMSTVFTPITTTYASQQPVSAISGPGIPSIAPVTTPVTSYPPVNYGTPSRRMSPQNALTPTGQYPNSSPLSESFSRHSLASIGNMGGSSGVHTPISHSPSHYLQQRNSPYRPVRQPHTLLYPLPPSAFLQQYHFANTVPPNQMHYQPIGRRNEVRTGIVPEFAMGGGHVHAVTPQPAPYYIAPQTTMQHQHPAATGHQQQQQYPPGTGQHTLGYSQHN
ncbi:hypothetical protein B0H66DRAFT_577386 [Apodospora peruviana]|uniref:Cyclin n=1 Tax=Apodospora peruviana TaxID=516989 RepID=A0AAE0HUU2_9PEZI|nr:hypothetical protein B0H66DRAFT_577386 [Apodospora peruviana]